MNPYNPPNTQASADEDLPMPNAKANLRPLLIPAFIGAVVGSIVLAPITRGPGDPTGHGIAAGLGGLISLLVAIIFRAIKRSNPTASGKEKLSLDDRDIP